VKIMKDKQPGSEMQEMLKTATHAVAALYLGDQLTAMQGTQGEDQRDEVWQRVAQELSAFGEPIRGLREAMKGVAETKKAYPFLTPVIRMPFMGVDNQPAREFLGDVLVSRIAPSRGYIDAAEELQSMASEMGLPQGWQSEQAKGVTLEQAVGKVLQGSLRVGQQPPPRQ
jgi:hypothetical protein